MSKEMVRPCEFDEFSCLFRFLFIFWPSFAYFSFVSHSIVDAVRGE
jgi:hypothetical protein